MKITDRKFSRNAPKKALLYGLAQSLIIKERITTTLVRGKEAARLTEHLITTGKKADLSAERELRRYLSDQAARKVIKDLVPRYQDRNGGYTRVVKLGQRGSDGAEVAFIELVR